MFPSWCSGWSLTLPWGLSPTPAALSSPRFISLLSNHWGYMWETYPLSSSMQLSDLHSSCTHTQTSTHMHGFNDACAPYGIILSEPCEGLCFPLSPSSTPGTTLDSSSIHIGNTSRTLPPSFLILSSPLILSSLLLLTITLWQIDGETVETVSDLILRGSKITADGDCSHEIKRHLLLGRKVMTKIAYWKAETLLCQQRSV